jgi:hypothetical protein
MVLLDFVGRLNRTSLLAEIGRLFGLIDPDQFEAAFWRWASNGHADQPRAGHPPP